MNELSANFKDEEVGSPEYSHKLRKLMDHANTRMIDLLNDDIEIHGFHVEVVIIPTRKVAR